MHVVWGRLHSKLHFFAVIAATVWYYMKGKTKQQTNFTTRGLIQTTRFFSHTSHLTKPNDMGHIGSKYGNGMAWPMAQLWVMFWLCRGCCFPYQTHVSQATFICGFYCFPLWDCYIFGSTPYIPHSIYNDMIWQLPKPFPYCPGLLVSDMGMLCTF